MSSIIFLRLTEVNHKERQKFKGLSFGIISFPRWGVGRKEVCSQSYHKEPSPSAAPYHHPPPPPPTPSPAPCSPTFAPHEVGLINYKPTRSMHRVSSPTPRDKPQGWAWSHPPSLEPDSRASATLTLGFMMCYPAFPLGSLREVDRAPFWSCKWMG